jgi:hypothetical protein
MKTWTDRRRSGTCEGPLKRPNLCRMRSLALRLPGRDPIWCRRTTTYVDDPTPGEAFNVLSISSIVRPLVSIPINQIAAAPTKYQNAK